jgi:hypothetical protein
MDIQDYLNKLKGELQSILDESLVHKSDLGKAHHFSSCIYEFSEQIDDASEKKMLVAVSVQLESATLSAAMGMYRQAFSSLRLAFEMGLGSVYFSAHKLGCGLS